MSLYSNIQVGKPKNSEVEITGEIPVEVVAENRKDVLREMRANFEAPGFRKGNVPEEIFIKHVDEMKALQEVAERVLHDAIPQMIIEAKLDILGLPHVNITKLAPGNPIGFTVRVGLKPEVKLGNYKKIAKGIMGKPESFEVTDEEVEKTIQELLKMTGGTELTDESVKKLGTFKDVGDFKIQLRENMTKEKESQAKMKKREEIADALIKESAAIIPGTILEREVHEMFGRLKEDLQKKNIKLEDYLKQIQKTEEELIAEERGYVERQLKTRFVLDAIAKAENIEPEDAEGGRETQIALTRYKDLDLERARAYVRQMMKNEKVMAFLEGTTL